MGVTRDSAQGDAEYPQTELRMDRKDANFSKNKKEVFDYLLKDGF